jgi:hypothetical protein
VLGVEVKAAGSGHEGGRQWMLHTLGNSWPSSRAMKSRPSENSSLKTTTCITGRVHVMLLGLHVCTVGTSRCDAHRDLLAS